MRNRITAGEVTRIYRIEDWLAKVLVPGEPKGARFGVGQRQLQDVSYTLESVARI